MVGRRPAGWIRSSPAFAREGAKVSLSSRALEPASDAGVQNWPRKQADGLAVAADVRSSDGLATGQPLNGRIVLAAVDLLYTIRRTARRPRLKIRSKFDDASWRAAFELLLLSAVRMIRPAVPRDDRPGGVAILLPTGRLRS